MRFVGDVLGSSMPTDTAGVDLVIDATVEGRSVSFAVSEDARRGAQRVWILRQGADERGLPGCAVRYRVMTNGLDSDELIYVAGLDLSEEDYLALIRAIDAKLFESLAARRPVHVTFLLVVHAPTPEYQREQGMFIAGATAEMAITKLLGRSPADMHHQGLSH